MTLGERIRACRQEAGMSQEQVAEHIGVSRQAVAKWEAGRCAPNANNLAKLAGLFGTTAGLLLAPEAQPGQTLAEQLYSLYEQERAKKAALQRQRRKQNARAGLLVAAGYLGIYLAGRLLWCGPGQGSLLGWLFTTRPYGAHSYLYGWLLSSRLFWCAMAVSVLPAFWGKRAFSCITLAGCGAGLLLGIALGPNPQGAALGHGDYGWAIWGAAYLSAVLLGILWERRLGRRLPTGGL